MIWEMGVSSVAKTYPTFAVVKYSPIIDKQ